MRAYGDSPAAGADSFDRDIDREHDKLIGPPYRPAGDVSQARADALAGVIDEAIVAQLAHRHGLGVTPVEKLP